MPSSPIPDLLRAAVQELGGSRRDGQERMARAVWQALADQRHLLVQAGTGTGKSLAYLVPSLAYAMEEDAKVVVATATLALQRQIMERDLPLAIAAVKQKFARKPVGAVLKGRHNYVCRHKLNGGYDDDQADLLDYASPAVRSGWTGSGLADEVRGLTRWAHETKTGDRDDFPDGASPRAWQQVSVTSPQCIGAKCPLVEQCFAEGARAAAANADLVVTNHAMLAIDAAGVTILPEYDALVVDEAHALTRSLTSARTAQLAARPVRSAADRARALGIVPEPLDRAARDLENALDQAPEGRLREGLPPAVQDAVAQLRSAARAAFSEVAALQDASVTSKQLASAALQELTDGASRFEAGQGDVYWVDRVTNGASVLNAAPLEVSGDLRATVLDRATTIMTSATLALGGSLKPAADAAGLGPEEWDGLDVGSPFDYPKQAILYLARDLPEPGRGDSHRAAQHDRIAELISASRGGTLGLFTSQRAAEALRPRLGHPIAVQGAKALPALVADFVADPAACLFGTISLWQGIDAPGITCRLVLIDRLAFPRPDDPVMSARAEAADRAGSSGFMTVSAGHAALMLAQGAGRLIRSTDDRGVVAVLDPRIVTKRYGQFLTRSMPPM
ncbi:MAG: ATP-dependent DNA helicase, partial [Bifidobacteriaceae bacterium]|nr:ATP-dependent DNA helicase [Bifidobacteriaceae bacterium]